MDLEIKIAENDPVRKLVEICEELDYLKLYDQYLRTWRKYSPETIFMLLVCGYMNRLYSSREIEKASSVVSDISSQSGMTILHAIIEGHTDAVYLSDLASRKDHSQNRYGYATISKCEVSLLLKI